MNKFFTQTGLVLLVMSAFSSFSQETGETTEGDEIITVIGGETASPGEYPWMASLVTDTGDPGCGASLIHPMWVLSAGHCFIDFVGIPQHEKVILNSVTNDPESLEPFSELITIEEIIVHQDYTGVFAGGEGPDIALVRMSVASTIDPVILATFEDEDNFAGEMPAEVLGWGKTETGGGGVDSLRHANTMFISDDTCAIMYAASGISNFHNLNAGGNICAGYYAGTDSSGGAQGDSGGPLFFTNDAGTHIQVGVVSGGENDITTEDFPGVYTLIPKYKEWIDSVIASYEDASSILAENREPLTIISTSNKTIEVKGLNAAHSYVFDIYTLSGKQVKSIASISGESQTIRTDEFETGIFILRVNNMTNGMVTVQKLITQ